MIIYVAGRMAGLPDYGRDHFMQAAEQLRSQGEIVLNPAELPEGMPPDRYMPICLALLDAADAVYMLTGWERSAGAQIEHQFAAYQHKRIFYESCDKEKDR